MHRLLIAATALLLLLAPAARAANVGFAQISIPDGAEPALKVGVWYPTDAPATPRPFSSFTQVVADPGAPLGGGGHVLIVMSHGTGGWYGGHPDTAQALARAGFVVAAVSHTGDTYDDHSQAARIWLRSEQVHRVIDYMLAAWPDHARLAQDKVGMWGFSAGGFTALVASGGTPDLTQVIPHCGTMPSAFECGLIGHVDAQAFNATLPGPEAYIHDPRIKAAVVAAPALGFTFGVAGLKGVTIPVQLWRAELDHVLPHPDYAEAVNGALPRRPEYHVVQGADHYDFLAPCPAALAAQVPEICASHPGFDRAAFHADFDAAVVAFFERTLK